MASRVSAPAPKQALLDGVRAVLRPLVRLLIARGITYPAFSRVLKEVYIEVARRDFSLSFKKQTDSRVALITGITRKEIGLLRRGQAPPAARQALDHTLATRVVDRWRAGPPYTTDDGTPYLLPYEAADRISFVDLVAEIGGDIPPRAVLDELLRLGAATLTPRGEVRLAGAAATTDGRAEEAAALRTELEAAVAALVGAGGRRGSAGSP